MPDTTHANLGERSLPQLLRDLSYSVGDLVRSEIALARAEAAEKATKIAGGFTSIAVGMVLGLAALLVVLQALVIALSEIMEPWLASSVVGAAVAALAFVMIGKGRRDLTAIHLMPQRTTDNLRRDAQVLSDHVRTERPGGPSPAVAASSSPHHPIPGANGHRDATKELNR